jgi:hypothetical protein
MSRKVLTAAVAAVMVCSTAFVLYGQAPATKPRAEPRKETRDAPTTHVRHSVLRVQDITGMKVKSPAMQDLGKVEDLVIDLQTGKVLMRPCRSAAFWELATSCSPCLFKR